MNNKLTLNYGVRLDVINPQTVNEAGNGGWLDLTTGQILVGGVGDVNLAGNVENSYNWAPRLGVSYQLNEKTVLRAGYGRSYDIGVFGSLFGHSVTQNLPVLSAQSVSAPNNFDRVFTLAQGPPSPTFPDPGSSGRFDLPGGVFTRAMPQKQRLPAVDAFNVTVQHQLSSTMSIEVGYVGNRGHGVFAGDGPTVNPNQPSIVGFGTLNTDQRRPFFNGLVRTRRRGPGRQFRLDAGDRLLLQLRRQLVRLASGALHQALQRRPAGQRQLHVAASRAGGRRLLLPRSDAQQGGGRLESHARPRLPGRGVGSHRAEPEVPVGHRARARRRDRWLAAQHEHRRFRAVCRSTSATAIRAPIETRAPGRVNLIGDPEGPETQDQWFNVTPIGSPGSAFSRPAVGTFGDMERNSLRGPGYWRVDASLFKNIPLGGSKSLQIRIESVNVLNHVNLGNPDSQVGVPGNNNPNAGRITGTAAGDLQRNVQFAVKFAF